MKLPLALLTLVLAALAAAGCTSSRAGSPRATAGPTTTNATATSATPTSSVARPKPLDLANVDTCQLLTEQQLATFAIDEPGRPGNSGGDSLLAGSPGCAFSSDAAQTGFLIIASTNIGLPEFLSKIKSNPSRQTIAVHGYPAAQEEGPLSAPERGSGQCFVDVDVADGQLLAIQFSQIAAQPAKRLPIETLCAQARAVAEAALTTLQGG